MMVTKFFKSYKGYKEAEILDYPTLIGYVTCGCRTNRAGIFQYRDINFNPNPNPKPALKYPVPYSISCIHNHSTLC